MEGQHFWIQLWHKKEETKIWTFFVDSTVLVNGYHIYSNSLLLQQLSFQSLLCMMGRLTSILYVCQFSVFLRSYPLSNFQEHVSKHLRSEFPQSKTGGYIHSLLCHYNQIMTVGRKLDVNISGTCEEIWLLFQFYPQVWLTESAHLGGRMQHTGTRKLTVPFPEMSLEFTEAKPCQGCALETD